VSLTGIIYWKLLLYRLLLPRKMINNIVAIIPARGGSKGIPRKNIKLFAGKPLIAHSIEQAKESEYVDRIFVSTEDNEIIDVALKYGADVVTRPKKLATDFASTEAVLQHALNYLEKDNKIGIVVLLEPTTPMRDKGIIDKAIMRLLLSTADSVVTVSKDYGYFWEKEKNRMIRMSPEYIPRQKRTPFYRENMQVYASKASVIRQGKRIGKTVVLIETKSPIIDLHDEFDWWLGEKIFEKEKK